MGSLVGARYEMHVRFWSDQSRVLLRKQVAQSDSLQVLQFEGAKLFNQLNCSEAKRKESRRDSVLHSISYLTDSR